MSSLWTFIPDDSFLEEGFSITEGPKVVRDDTGKVALLEGKYVYHTWWWCENEDLYEDVVDAAEARGVNLKSHAHETVQQAIDWCLNTYKLIKEMRGPAE